MPKTLRFPELGTERLRLKQPSRTDGPAALKIFSDPEVLRYYNVDAMSSVEEAVAMLESRRRRFDTGYGIRWSIHLRESGEYIGSCGFEVVHKAWRFAEIGYELGRPYWGRGYMREALAAMIRYGLSSMDLHRIEAQVEPGNERSKGILRRLGFREEGLARERGYWRGAHHDLVQFGLLAHELAE